MGIDRSTMEWEQERLRRVTGQIGLQLQEGRDSAGRLRKNAVDLQKSMWDHVNPQPRDLDDLANIWQFQTDLVREGSKAIFQASRVVRLERMLKSPYFARIDFREDGCEEADAIYLGIFGLREEKTPEMLVYDWRAPICSMFYDFELGKSSYTCPAGEITGELTLKRQYRIWNGEIQFLFDSSIAIQDEILQEILGRSADSRMKTIVASIQREQNSVIRDDSHRILLVTGPAGCGKTSIALHRAAYLLYRYREEISSENIAIFSPNPIFSDYISEVLPELGEENIHRTTFREYAIRVLGNGAVVEDSSQQMEYLLRQSDDTGLGDSDQDAAAALFLERTEGIRYKSSSGIIDDIFHYVSGLEENRMFEDLSFHGQEIESAEEISEYFRKELKFLPVGKRLEKIKNRLTAKLDVLMRIRTEEVVKEVAEMGEYPNPAEIRSRSLLLVRAEASEAKERIAGMTGLTVLDCYRDFLAAVGKVKAHAGMNSDDSYRSPAGTYIYYEDIAPILLLQGLLFGFPDMDSIRHVIVDEVQDYTPIHFEIFKRLFKTSSLTLLGDPHQAVCPFVTPFHRDEALAILGTDSSASVRLGKSYRSTEQITRFCNAIKGSAESEEIMEREGELPGVICSDKESTLLSRIKEEIDSLRADGFQSVAVIPRTEKDCLRLYNILSGQTGIELITAKRQEFFTGTVILPSYLSKGLEFDAVLVVCTENGSYDKPEETGLAYTVCTRALHRLQVFCVGGTPGFIRNIDNSYYKLVR